MISRRHFVMVLLVIASVALLAVLLPVGTVLLRIIDYVAAAGLAGAICYGIVYALATVLLIPGSLLGLGAGLLYGPVWGTALVSPASVVGATLAFLLARGQARPWVAQRVAGDRRFVAIDEAVGKNGFRLVILLRLSPAFPFTLLNYALGLTRVSLGSYVLGSFLGMLPGTVLYVYLGSLIPNIAELARGAPDDEAGLRRAFFWAGLMMTIVVTVYVTRLARGALRRALRQSGALASKSSSVTSTSSSAK